MFVEHTLALAWSANQQKEEKNSNVIQSYTFLNKQKTFVFVKPLVSLKLEQILHPLAVVKKAVWWTLRLISN